jgi:hypothetical protein
MIVPFILFAQEETSLDLYKVAISSGFLLKQCRVVKVRKSHQDILKAFKISGEGSLEALRKFLIELEVRAFILGPNLCIKVKKNGTLACTLDIYKLFDSS